MSSSHTLTFLSSPGAVIVSILFVLLAAGFSFAAWRRAGYSRAHGLLELLRMAVVLLGALMFNQPEFIEEFQPNEKPTIAVLCDSSPSMNTQDVADKTGHATQHKTRRDVVAPLSDSTTWENLQEQVHFAYDTFPTSEDQQSNLHEPLATALSKHNNLRAIVFVSDGDWNDGPPPVEAATRLRLAGVPVFAVPVGSPSPLPDVELLSLNAPTFGIAGKSVRVPFTVESSLPRDFVAKVVLRVSDGEEISEDVRIAAMGRTSHWIVWKPQETGDYTLELEVTRHQEETIDDNNVLSAPIVIREEKLRVLVVETYPRWEYRYLRNALSRDPGVEVSCLLFHPGLSKVGGGSTDYLKEFPEGLDHLSEFDVVFLGDVGVEEGHLTEEQCRLLKGLVEHQASGLVFMPGWQGRQVSLLDTELSELYPVELDASQPGGWGSRTPSHFELTELGRRSLLTKLADTADDNLEVWDGLPGFQWYAPVLRARAGTEVLCVHKDSSNEYGRLPLLATRTFGAGKVLFMGTDGAWRWRKGVEDKFHYRFWGQVVRWMAYQRNMAKGETMRLYYSPDQPQINHTLALSANVMETSGEPLQSGDVTARITAPSGKTETVRFVLTGEEWGSFAGRYTADEPGSHQVTLACQQTGATLDASFFVQGAATERVGRPARPEVLVEIARVTRGKVIETTQLDEMANALASMPQSPPAVRRVHLWCHPITAALFVTLVGVFWVGRKAIGLI